LSLRQQKAVGPEEVRSWGLDLEAMSSCAAWAMVEPELLAREVAAILEAFPTFIAVLGQRLPEDQAWVEAGVPTLCPACGDFTIFDRGVRCVACDGEVAQPPGSMVGLVGRIPGLISGRPFDRALEGRMVRMERPDHPHHGLRDLAGASLLDVNGRRYLAPRFGLWFSAHWPHSDPPVMVWPEYFPLLGIPPDHVYQAGSYHRLCLYANWREQPAVNVLQNRVAPRLIIDLMVADLACLELLDTCLERLDCTLYELYNMVGRAAKAAPLRQIYRELVGL